MASLLEQVEGRGTAGLLESERLYEIVDGRRVDKEPMGAAESYIANVLACALWSWCGPQRGVPVIEALFELSGNLKRRPDLAFVPFERWPQPFVPDAEAWNVVPSLAVEVVSRTNTAEDVQRKIREYFASGVDLVWVIYPRERQAFVYRGPKQIEVLDENDVLEGGDTLPGFRLPVARLFERIAAPEVEEPAP